MKTIITMHTIDPSGSVLPYPPAVFADQELEDECAAADEVIEQRLGRRPQYLAYPYGYIDERVRRLVRGRYRDAVTTRLPPLGVDADKAALPRIDSYYLRSALLYRSSTIPCPEATSPFEACCAASVGLSKTVAVRRFDQ